ADANPPVLQLRARYILHEGKYSVEGPAANYTNYANVCLIVVIRGYSNLIRSHAMRTCSSVLRKFPTVNRSTVRLFRRVWEIKIFPDAFTRSIRAWFALSSPFKRKQTVLNGTGAINSNRASSSTHDANNLPSRICSAMRSRNPSTPK